MGSTLLGDIASGALRGTTISYASVASNGAGAAIGAIGVGNWRAPQSECENSRFDSRSALHGASSCGF